jgi:hypothetical protein
MVGGIHPDRAGSVPEYRIRSPHPHLGGRHPHPGARRPRVAAPGSRPRTDRGPNPGPGRLPLPGAGLLGTTRPRGPPRALPVPGRFRPSLEQDHPVPRASPPCPARGLPDRARQGSRSPGVEAGKRLPDPMVSGMEKPGWRTAHLDVAHEHDHRGWVGRSGCRSQREHAARGSREQPAYSPSSGPSGTSRATSPFS